MNYKAVKDVHIGGFVETGASAIISDRNTSLTVPYTTSVTSPTSIEWTITDDYGKTYTVTVPVTISTSNGQSTATYTKGTVTIVEVTNGNN